MADAGFFEQKSASPMRFVLVAGAHAVVLGALLMSTTTFIADRPRPTDVEFIELPKTPPEEPQPQQREQQTPQRQDQVVIPDRQIDLPDLPPVLPQTGTQIASNNSGTGVIDIPPLQPVDPPAQPVRRDAQIDSRYAHLLQPQYPLAEQRAQRGGTVVIRVTIGPDGRVRSAERVSATSDAFWEAARQQALGRWRFRPATLDGRPVESVKTMTIHFRIEDV